MTRLLYSIGVISSVVFTIAGFAFAGGIDSIVTPTISTATKSTSTVSPTSTTISSEPDVTTETVSPTTSTATTSSSLVTPSSTTIANIFAVSTDTITPSSSSASVSSDIVIPSDSSTTPTSVVITPTTSSVVGVDSIPSDIEVISTSTISPTMSSATGTDTTASTIPPITTTTITPSMFTVTGVSTNSPPVCSEASPSVETLWPPNHKMKNISVLGVTDPDGDDLTITIDSIFQDEPVPGPGKKHSPDGSGVGTDTAQVRAERLGGENGRVYHIGFTADDGNGGMCSGEVTVGVPHNKKSTPIDDGTIYDSTN